MVSPLRLPSAFGSLDRRSDFVLVTIPHLGEEILENVRNVPVLFGGRFVEG